MKSVTRPTLRPSFGPGLLHTLTGRTRPSRVAKRHRLHDAAPAAVAVPDRTGEKAAAPLAAPAAPLEPSGNVPSAAGSAIKRAKSAGGPEDVASYSCSCGLLFTAPVSTNVTCPHCGAEQAW